MLGQDFEQLWTLVVAAGAAPGVRHRWATVGHLIHAVLEHERRGTRPVHAHHLERLLAACTADEPRLAAQEDFLPQDPRDRVFARFDSEVLRLFPGSVERPLADVDRALLVADATDDQLIDQMGFGVAHVLEVGLRYADHAIGLMHPAWPAGDLPGEGPAVLTDGELDVANALIESGTPETLTCTPELRRALDWLTCPAEQLPYRPSNPESVFGRFLRVQTAESKRWLPLAFLPESLSRAVSELAGAAAGASPEVDRRFAGLVAARVRQALWRFSPEVHGAEDVNGLPQVADGNVQWVMPQGPQRALLVQVMASVKRGMRRTQTPAALTAVTRRRTNPAQPTQVPMAKGRVVLNPDVEASAMFVVAGAGHLLAPQDPSMLGMSLEDLIWASTSADADTDLYTFCRDVTRPGRARMFGWEAINIWEWWRSNGKSLSRAGQVPTLMIAPHHGNAEWDRGVKQADWEIALAQLNLGGLRDSCATDDFESGPPAVYYWARPTSEPETLTDSCDWDGVHARPPMEGWVIHLSSVPVAIQNTDPTWTASEFRLLHDLSGALAFGFRQSDQSWRTNHAGSDVTGYRLHLRAVAPSTETERVMWLASTSIEVGPHGRTCVVVLDVAVDAFAGDDAVIDMDTVHQDMAASIRDVTLAAGLLQSQAEQVHDAWISAPPTLAIRVMEPITARQNLLSPIRLDAAMVSEVDRLVAEAVHAEGVQPGDFFGEEAKTLDRSVLAPAALTVLNDRLSAHDVGELLAFGMRQLERCVADRDRVLRSLEQSAALLSVKWDPVERYREIADERLLLRRCIETTLEGALRATPAGSRPVDDLAWMQVTAAARAYLAATSRSESVHHQVSPVGLRVTTSYEVTVIPGSDSQTPRSDDDDRTAYDLDMVALARRRAELRLQTDADPVAAEPAGATPESNATDPDVDAAMLESYGMTALDLKATLFALARWPIEETDDDTTASTVEEITAYVLDATVLGDALEGRSRVEAAIAALTSRSEDLQAADWKPWHARSRRRRLLVQPLPQTGDGKLIVAPHWCLSSLSVYGNYLSQGQLPWSQPPAPRKLDDALARVRDRRNKALEEAVSGQLRSAGWTTIVNVKENKAARLNVPALSTEIDCVAGRADINVIWLLEVKDPVETYATPEIRRSLDTFFKDSGSKRSYATQLQRKYDDLAPHAGNVATALGLPPRPESDPYVVHPMFVTRWPTAAEFVTSAFPFVSLPQLLSRVEPDAVASVNDSGRAPTASGEGP
jgi:hypothetical protein